MRDTREGTTVGSQRYPLPRCSSSPPPGSTRAKSVSGIHVGDDCELSAHGPRAGPAIAHHARDNSLRSTTCRSLARTKDMRALSCSACALSSIECLRSSGSCRRRDSV
eukprot:1160346-Rhodomonas_salina.4